MKPNDLKYIKLIAQKVIAGKGTSEEAKLIAEWLKTSEGLEFANEKITEDFFQNNIEGLEDLLLNKPIDSDRIYSNIDSKIRQKRIRRIIWQMVAIFIPFLILAGIASYLNFNFDIWNSSQYEIVEVPAGEKMMIILPDGTNVYLNACSQLQYPKHFGFGRRRVILNGEAYFSVESSNFRKFEVKTSGGTVVVHGTSFNIKNFDNEDLITIILDKGSISFETDNGDDVNKTKMQPDDLLIYNKKSKELNIKKTKNAESYSNWRQNIISFNNTSLEDILNELSRKFNVQFEIIDEKAKIHSFTLRNGQMNLDSILYDIQNVSPIRFKNTDNNHFQVIVKK